MSRPRSRQQPTSRTQNDTANPNSLALIFPGQGSQHAGMGKEIAESSLAARCVYEQADEALGFSISRLCHNGSDIELRKAINTQPALLTTSLAYLASLRELAEKRGLALHSSLMAGHSLGQFTAAVAANALDFDDGVRLVLERGRIMAEFARAHPGGLATILGMEDEHVRQLCRDASPDGKVSVAVLNGPGQLVISGETDALERAVSLAKERGGRALRLSISTPGHTALLSDPAAELSRYVSTLTFRAPNPPLVSNITAELLTTPEDVRTELADQMCASVLWADCVATMIDAGVVSFIEVGPGHALSKLVRRIIRDIEVQSTEGASPDALAKAIEASTGRIPIGAGDGVTQQES